MSATILNSEIRIMNIKKNVSEFNHDIIENQGYKYINTTRISARFSNNRTTLAIHAVTDWSGKHVLDIGCGDGSFTRELCQTGAASVLGVDPASEAIELANSNPANVDSLSFAVGNIYTIDQLNRRFDIVVLRGVLHHLPDAAAAVLAVAKITDQIIIVEPNGMNPILKIIEKVSPYHRLHEEQSFLASTLKKWCVKAGAKVEACEYLNIVPLFCLDVPARILKTMEPLIEKIPLVRNIACGQIIIKAIVR